MATESKISVMLPAALLLGAGAAWWFSRSGRHARPGFSDVSKASRQAPPPDAAAVPADAFGETGVLTVHQFERFPPQVMSERARAFLDLMDTRRTMRFYSQDEPPPGVVEACVAAAGTAPSGAHHQPWFFAIVRAAELKRKIRELVEEEELVNYERRMKKSWIADLSTMTGSGADSRLKGEDGAPKKAYLTEAPAIIALFKQTYALDGEGNRKDNYYVSESCGIAAGMLVAALHNAGLATLTSTPMGAEAAIRELLERPQNEKLFLLMPVGYPAQDATVPYRVPLRKPEEALMKTY